MKTYPDPSVLIAAYVEEPNTSIAADFLTGQAPGMLLTSWWAFTEITSALGVKARAGGIDADARPAILARLRRSLERSAQVLPVLHRDFLMAEAYMERASHPLRAGDALHLAIASGREATVWTFDVRMTRAGQALGLDVRLLA